MDPESFWDKVVLLLIDKTLLAVGGLTIAYVSAVIIEKHKRHQAVVLELGKIRAQAFARIYSIVSHQTTMMCTVLRDPGPDRLMEPLLKDEAIARYRKLDEEVTAAGQIQADVDLMEPAIHEIVTDLFNELAHLYRETKWLTSTEAIGDRKSQREKLLNLKKALTEYIPTLPKP